MYSHRADDASTMRMWGGATTPRFTHILTGREGRLALAGISMARTVSRLRGCHYTPLWTRYLSWNF